DDADPNEVRPEFQSGKGRVDYALFCNNGQPGLFLEVKAVGKAATADIQLFEYAFHEGAQIAVLTDGRIWSFYLPGQPGTYEDRKVYQLDLLERSIADCEQRFHRYLEKDRVAKNLALEDARADYASKASQKLAAATIPQAWAELLSETDIIKKLLREQTEALCGHAPSEAALQAFVNGLSDQLALDGTAPKPARSPVGPRRLAALPTVASPALKGISWKVLDCEATARNQNEALVGYLNELMRRFPDRVDAIRRSVGTRGRAHIAATPDAIYPKRPDLGRKNHVRLASGLCLGTNVSREEKLKIARKAASACGLAWPDQALLEI
ncbi:MAG: hypothetical protein SNJ63_10905, partial [Sphingomonadaceae bacterium]